MSFGPPTTSSKPSWSRSTKPDYKPLKLSAKLKSVKKKRLARLLSVKQKRNARPSFKLRGRLNNRQRKWLRITWKRRFKR